MLNVQTIGAITTGKVTSLQGHTVLVRDHYGNPLVVVTELDSGVSSITTLQDEHFQQSLQALGLGKLELEHQRLQPPASLQGAARLDPHQLAEFVQRAATE